MEDLAFGAWREESFFGGVELDFVLETGDGSVAVNDQGGDAEGVAGEAFRAENDGDVGFCGGLRYGGPCVFEEGGIGRGNLLSRSPVAGYVAFREADQAGVCLRGLGDGFLGQRDGFAGRGW